MKITEMIHATVTAFKPERHPVYALIALAMLLFALVAMVYLCGSGAGSLMTRLL